MYPLHYLLLHKFYGMVYNVIGTSSGSSLAGLDLVFAVLTEVRGKWEYEIRAAERLPYDPEWEEKLGKAATLSARDYMLLHSEYGHFIGHAVKSFIGNNQLDHQVHFVVAHGHAVFHVPSRKMTGQLGDGAAIAAITGLSVITDLRAMDVAVGGKGAPLFPLAEQLLFPDFQYRLNLGENATIAAQPEGALTASDVCPCNYILDSLAATMDRPYDENGQLAEEGKTDAPLLEALNGLAFYDEKHPRTIAAKFGTATVLQVIQKHQIPTQNKLNTYCKHIAAQIARTVSSLQPEGPASLLLTGGGSFNTYLVKCIQEELQPLNVSITIPEEWTSRFRTSLMIALLGTLRWRQETNAFASITGAERDSVGGALWTI